MNMLIRRSLWNTNWIELGKLSWSNQVDLILSIKLNYSGWSYQFDKINMIKLSWSDLDDDLHLNLVEYINLKRPGGIFLICIHRMMISIWPEKMGLFDFFCRFKWNGPYHSSRNEMDHFIQNGTKWTVSWNYTKNINCLFFHYFIFS